MSRLLHSQANISDIILFKGFDSIDSLVKTQGILYTIQIGESRFTIRYDTIRYDRRV